MFNWQIADRKAETDRAGVGQCALGVRLVLESMGVSGMSGHGYQWMNLARENSDWVQINVNPDNAPVGSVIAWDRDRNAAGRGGGKEFGHVEIKGLDPDTGRVKFYSDAARDTWGGSRRHLVNDPSRYAVFVRRDQLTSEQLAALTTSTNHNQIFANAGGASSANREVTPGSPESAGSSQNTAQNDFGMQIGMAFLALLLQCVSPDQEQESPDERLSSRFEGPAAGTVPPATTEQPVVSTDLATGANPGQKPSNA